jgi:hypothetical protein
MIRELLAEIGERLKFIEERLHQYDLRIQRLFRQDERCRRLAKWRAWGRWLRLHWWLRWATRVSSEAGVSSLLISDWFRAIARAVAALSSSAEGSSLCLELPRFDGWCWAAVISVV